MSARKSIKSIPSDFESLTSIHPLRPIRSDRELELAERVSDRLAVLNHRTRDQEDYLQTLSLLIETYEEEHHAIDLSDLGPIDALRSLLDAHGMTASDLGRLLGNRSLGAAILRGHRELSKANILQICAHFAVGPELFLRPSPARKAG